MTRSLGGRQGRQSRRGSVDPGRNATDEAAQSMWRKGYRAGMTDRQPEAVDPVAPAVGGIHGAGHAISAEGGTELLRRFPFDAQAIEQRIDPCVCLVKCAEIRMSHDEVIVVARVENAVDCDDCGVHG